MPVKMNKVAVIGAGAAGLCAARHLLRVNIQPVIFEQKDNVGGTWVYEDVDINNIKEVFSSMYDNLRTNLPKQVMLFPDFPFSDDEPSFMHFSSVAKYLQQYSEHFNITKHIKFNTKVVEVSSLLEESNMLLSGRFIKWNVSSLHSITSQQSTEVFDAVVVCNGKNSEPHYPKINGLESFKGETLHSHYYRRAKDFTGKNVLVLGAGPSGTDIILELAKECNMVHLSHKGERHPSKLPDNVIEQLNISHVDMDGKFVFENKKHANVDVFIPCTGYKTGFPFLIKNNDIIVEEDRIVRNLYKHLFSIKHPSIAFVGLPTKVAPFPLFQQQCALIASVLSGQAILPTEGEMVNDTEKERSDRISNGESEKDFHGMRSSQFRYSNELSDISGFPKNPPIIENLYKYTSHYRRNELKTYKDMEYRKINEREFEVL